MGTFYSPYTQLPRGAHTALAPVPHSVSNYEFKYKQCERQEGSGWVFGQDLRGTHKVSVNIHRIGESKASLRLQEVSRSPVNINTAETAEAKANPLRKRKQPFFA